MTPALLFFKRVGREASDLLAFGGPWQHLQKEWVERISGPHSRDESPRHEQGEITGRQTGSYRDRWVERQQSAELVRIADGVGQFPLPTAVG